MSAPSITLNIYFFILSNSLAVLPGSLCCLFPVLGKVPADHRYTVVDTVTLLEMLTTTLDQAPQVATLTNELANATY